MHKTYSYCEIDLIDTKETFGCETLTFSDALHPAANQCPSG